MSMGGSALPSGLITSHQLRDQSNTRMGGELTKAVAMKNHAKRQLEAPDGRRRTGETAETTQVVVRRACIGPVFDVAAVRRETAAEPTRGEKNGFHDIKWPRKKKTSDRSFIHNIQSIYTIQRAKSRQKSIRGRKKHRGSKNFPFGISRYHVKHIYIHISKI